MGLKDPGLKDPGPRGVMGQIKIRGRINQDLFMTFKINLNTGPNHQYSDLEAEKLVYKLLTLVLDHRISI